MPLQLSNSILLTVLGPPPPQPVITVPSGVQLVPTEILQPFQFNMAGLLTSTSDEPTKVQMHVLDLLFTRKGERVMQPNYGIGIQDYIFEPIDSPAVVTLVNTVREQIGLWEPGVSLRAVEALPGDAMNGFLALLVSFTVGLVPTIHTITYNLAGQRIEV